jgi:hypothetical protein
MSARLRVVLLAGCVALSALHAGEARAMFSQGLGEPYAGPAVDVQRTPERAAHTGGSSASLAPTGNGADVAVREFEPFLSGLGLGL